VAAAAEDGLGKYQAVVAEQYQSVARHASVVREGAYSVEDPLFPVYRIELVDFRIVDFGSSSPGCFASFAGFAVVEACVARIQDWGLGLGFDLEIEIDHLIQACLGSVLLDLVLDSASILVPVLVLALDRVQAIEGHSSMPGDYCCHPDSAFGRLPSRVAEARGSFLETELR
jgi:hypothetical protein